MGFMQQDIQGRTHGYAVETECGTTYLPSFVTGDLRIRGTHEAGSRRFDDLCAAVRDYVEGRDIRSVEYMPTCYWARMSAPGYMDCTEWESHRTIRDARESLADSFGDE